MPPKKLSLKKKPKRVDQAALIEKKKIALMDKQKAKVAVETFDPASMNPPEDTWPPKASEQGRTGHAKPGGILAMLERAEKAAEPAKAPGPVVVKARGLFGDDDPTPPPSPTLQTSACEDFGRAVVAGWAVTEPAESEARGRVRGRNDGTAGIGYRRGRPEKGKGKG